MIVENPDNRVHPFPVANKRAKLRRQAGEASPLSESQLRWLSRGLGQAGGKLPLFDEEGQRYNEKTIRSCIEKGWAEPWFNNPVKPDWLVCRLTDTGREILSAAD